MTAPVYTPPPPPPAPGARKLTARVSRSPYQGDVHPPELAAQLAVHLQQDFLDHAPHLARLAHEGLCVDDLAGQGAGEKKKTRENRGWRCPQRAGGPVLPSPLPTWEGTGDCTQHSFLMAPYKSSRLLEMMHRRSCTLSCGEGDAGASDAGAPKETQRQHGLS